VTRARDGLGSLLRGLVPEAVRARTSQRLKARVRAILGIEPWPDLAVRHPLFRRLEYRTLREAARVFDVPRPNKPVLERGHQTSFLLACWFKAAGVRSAFQVGYADGRHLFYLSRAGITCGGTDLPPGDTAWVRIPEGSLDDPTLRRLLRIDFFRLTTTELRSVMARPGGETVDVLFSEATFETLLPWRSTGVSVPAYAVMDPGALRALMYERFPAKLEELSGSVRNMIFIEPEPDAGGAGAVFKACAMRLPGWAYGVWAFQKPFDRLFRLSPGHPTSQTVYSFTRDATLLEELRAYAIPQ
jgi:hypothetical protein